MQKHFKLVGFVMSICIMNLKWRGPDHTHVLIKGREDISPGRPPSLKNPFQEPLHGNC